VRSTNAPERRWSAATSYQRNLLIAFSTAIPIVPVLIKAAVTTDIILFSVAE
jgi:hypothetical protein